MEDIDSPGILSDEYSEYDLEEENYEIDKQDDDGKLKGK